MQEAHRKETLLSIQLFQIEATHLLKMAINIFYCNTSQHLFPSCSIDRCVSKMLYNTKANSISFEITSFF